MANIFTRPLSSFVKDMPQGFDILHGIHSPSVCQWLWAVPICNYLAQVALMNANEVCRLCWGELTNGLKGGGRKCPVLVSVELARQLIRVRRNEGAQIAALLAICRVQHLCLENENPRFLQGTRSKCADRNRPDSKPCGKE